MQYPEQFSRYLKRGLGVLALASVCCAPVLSAQKRGAAKTTPAKTSEAGSTTKPEPSQAKAEEKSSVETAKGRSWRLELSPGTPAMITLWAKDAPLAEIATSLGKKIKAPVFMSPLMEKQRVTVEINAVNLEGTLRMLAPQSYIDYEAGGDSLTPKPLALYLYGANEPAPSVTTIVKNSSQMLLVEGDTEEGTEEYEKRQQSEENPLRVTYDRRLLSVRAKKQPLSVVLYKIASELGVPFDMRADSTEVVDVNFTNYSVDQAVHALSPLVRFYYRTDLQTFEIQPLRLALVAQPPRS